MIFITVTSEILSWWLTEKADNTDSHLATCKTYQVNLKHRIDLIAHDQGLGHCLLLWVAVFETVNEVPQLPC